MITYVTIISNTPMVITKISSRNCVYTSPQARPLELNAIPGDNFPSTTPFSPATHPPPPPTLP